MRRPVINKSSFLKISINWILNPQRANHGEMGQVDLQAQIAAFRYIAEAELPHLVSGRRLDPFTITQQMKPRRGNHILMFARQQLS